LRGVNAEFLIAPRNAPEFGHVLLSRVPLSGFRIRSDGMQLDVVAGQRNDRLEFSDQRRSVEILKNFQSNIAL
jgi:hypothetical protein